MGYLLPFLLVGLACCVAPASAFGAGNIASISKIEGWCPASCNPPANQNVVWQAPTGVTATSRTRCCN